MRKIGNQIPNCPQDIWVVTSRIRSVNQEIGPLNLPIWIMNGVLNAPQQLPLLPPKPV